VVDFTTCGVGSSTLYQFYSEKEFRLNFSFKNYITLEYFIAIGNEARYSTVGNLATHCRSLDRISISRTLFEFRAPYPIGTGGKAAAT